MCICLQPVRCVAVLLVFICLESVQHVVGVLDKGSSGPGAQLAQQLARRATLDRRCDEVTV